MRSLRRAVASCSTIAVLVVAATRARAVPDAPLACPAPGTASASEACVRRELGVPPAARRVMIFSQSSHLDWDWRHTFEEYFEGPLADPLLFLLPGPVDGIFSDAVQLLTQPRASPGHYYYSVAEIGYLARYVAAHPEVAATLRAVGADLRIVGGGITSPDSLLPPGEAFIRDYLVGKAWVDATLQLPVREAWLPDDFGHDSQLPVVLEAMGLDAVGFGRVPGVAGSLQSLGFQPPDADSTAAHLLADGLDFVWRAADGSRTTAHWMPGGYCQGDWALGATPGTATTDALARVLAVDGAASRTPYVFVPVGCDFARPRPDLRGLIDAWNAQQYASTGVWVVAATFDHYVQLLRAHRAALPTRRFTPTPYWTGFYATRPLLKALHLRATQALLGAETFGAVADGVTRRDPVAWLAAVRARTGAVHAGWETLVPANHHDFVTGTAVDAVYEGEQLPRLAAALAAGETERARALAQVAAAIRPDPADGPDPVVVFNPLGFARTGLVEMPAPPDSATAAFAADQTSAEGGRLFLARVPSLGYATEDRARAGASAGAVTLSMPPDGGVAVLENDLLRATLRRDAGWGITSLVDKRSGDEVVGTGAVANALVPYADQGGLYRFGNEMKGCRLEPLAGEGAGSALTILEHGPLRVRVAGQTTAGGRTFRKEYALVAGEPFLRMLSTGSAAPGTSVMVRFPLGGPIDDLVYGTPYHWDEQSPERAGPLTFEATHDFVVPRSGRRARAAIFHAGVPAWAAGRDGLLLGALWRNANREQCDYEGAEGSDPHEVTVSYAIRVPTGVTSPRTGAQLREALGFTTPLLAVAGRPAGDLPRALSLASTKPSAAILTAAKAGTEDPGALVLRIYQPTNAPLRVSVRTAAVHVLPMDRRILVEPRTALEEPLRAADAATLHLDGDARRFRFVARRALSTIALRAPGAR